jgi:hypothetical protein
MPVVTAFEADSVIGPHTFRAGLIDGTGPFAGPTKARVETTEEALRWVDFFADEGYDQIKIYSSVPVELVPAMTERAKSRGLRVSGHIPAGMWAEDAVRAGYDEIQHINMLFLNFYKDVTETRNPDRFIKVAERGADLDLEGEDFQAFVALLKERGTVVDPTVAIFFDLFVQEPGQPAPSSAAIHDRLPAQVARSALSGGLPIPPDQKARYAASAHWTLWRRCTGRACPSSPGPTRCPVSPCTRSLSFMSAPASRPRTCCALPPSVRRPSWMRAERPVPSSRACAPISCWSTAARTNG